MEPSRILKKKQMGRKHLLLLERRIQYHYTWHPDLHSCLPISDVTSQERRYALHTQSRLGQTGLGMALSAGPNFGVSGGNEQGAEKQSSGMQVSGGGQRLSSGAHQLSGGVPSLSGPSQGASVISPFAGSSMSISSADAVLSDASLRPAGRPLTGIDPAGKLSASVPPIPTAWPRYLRRVSAL